MNRHLFLGLWLSLFLLFFQEVRADGIDLNKYLNASVENPYDVSNCVPNASCTENLGWSRNVNDAAASYTKHNKEFDSDVYKGVGIESWYFSPVRNADLIWQQIDNLLPGTYVISAYVVGQVYNDASNKGKCLPGIYFRVNDERVAVTSNKWQKLSLTCKIGHGESLKIAICADETNANDWVGLSHVTLSLVASGEAENIGMSEDFDVTCVRDVSYANVKLKKSLPSDELVTVCFPFDVDSALVDQYFKDVQEIVEATNHGNEVVVVTADAYRMEKGKVYLVSAKDETKTCYDFNHVLVDVTAPNAVVLKDGNKLHGGYTQLLTVQPTYTLQTDGKTFHRFVAPVDVKGFSGWIEK